MPLEEAVVSAVLLQQAARRRHEAMQSMDGGDEHASRSAVQREEQLLGEVMGSQAFMRARGRKLRDQEGRDHL